ncbi:MAG: hypothetical protein J5835_05770 [Bacteroidales bacterium]|nr:hypothetical protein [Bacteroidales bacterium]
MDYTKCLKFYPDFPIPGVNFVDIIPFVQNKEVFRSLVKDLGRLSDSPNIVAPEARGFLFAAPMLTECEKVQNIIPFRKKGKLPHSEGDLVGIDITKEYGRDQIFFRLSDIAAGKAEDGVFKVTFFDDILATGGTARGIAEGLEKQKVFVDGKDYGIKVTDFVFLVEIEGLGGREAIEAIAPVKSLMRVTE